MKANKKKIKNNSKMRKWERIKPKTFKKMQKNAKQNRNI